MAHAAGGDAHDHVPGPGSIGVTSSTESGWSCSRHRAAFMVFPLASGCGGPQLPAPPPALPSPNGPHPARPSRAVGVERRRALAGPGRSAAQRARRATSSRRGARVGDGRRHLRLRPRARAPHRRARRRAARGRRGRRAPPAGAERRGLAGPHPRRDRRGAGRATSRPGVDPRATSPTLRCSSGCSAPSTRSRRCTTATCSWSRTAGSSRVVERHLDSDADGLIPNLGGLWLEHDDKGLRLGERIVLLDDVAGHPAPAALSPDSVARVRVPAMQGVN